jgi:hypothetical protein
MRNGSQNATFHLLEPDAPDEHPRGEALATRAAEHLRSLGLEVTAPDNWRDSGWDFECRSGEDTLQVVIAGAVESGRWFLQIGSTKDPGFIARTFGRGNYPSALSCFRVAGTLHAALTAFGATDQRWRWDGPPRTEDPDHPEAPVGGAG